MCVCVSRHPTLSGLLFRRRRQPLKLLLSLLFLVLFLDLSGVHRHLLEIDYETGFSYPLEGNVAAWVDKLMSGSAESNVGQIPSPLRQFDHSILIDAPSVCRGNRSSGKPALVLMVKSACDHTQRRSAIRNTWCKVLRRYQGSIQCAFVVARRPDDPALELQIRLESDEHGDLVLVDFLDSYFNNTLKSIAGFRWALRRCTSARHFFFVDDDFYVSVPNLIRLIKTVDSEKRVGQEKPSALLADLPVDSGDAESAEPDSLLLGYVFHSAPHRHKLSKWYVSLAEYPFSLWPPYCTAGAFIVSRHTLHCLVLASGFVRYFRFDDVYIGIMAKKLGIRPRHTELVRFYPEKYREQLYANVVGAHGYGDPQLMTRFWYQQHRLGYA